MNTLLHLLDRVTQTFRGKGRKGPTGKRSSCRLEVEALENRLVPTTFASTTLVNHVLIPVTGSSVSTHAALSVNPYVVLTPGTSAWFLADFSDANLRNLAQSDFTRDAAINRNDMLALFSQAEADGVVSAAEFHDLKFMVGNAQALNMFSDVQYLANKVVNGDPGNSTYQYIGFEMSVNDGPWVGSLNVAPLGNLYSGSPAWQLNQLVDKWFMGMDLPTTDISRADGSGATYNYGYDTVGTLFGPDANSVSYFDIHQGDTGDCWLLSAAADLAKQSPKTIYNMFTNNGDGTYTVHLYDIYDHPAYVTVNRWLPVDDNYNFAFANQRESLTDPNAKLWVPLMEKAMAQLNHSGQLGSGRDGSNSYQGLSQGYGGLGMFYLTGLNSSVPQTLDQNSFNAAVTAGDLVTLLSWGTELDSVTTTPDGWTVVPNHVYAVVGHNDQGIYFLFNPWGTLNPNADVEVGLDWAQITDIFLSYDYGTNPMNVPIGARATMSASSMDFGAFIGGSTPTMAGLQGAGAQYLDIQPNTVAQPERILALGQCDALHGHQGFGRDMLTPALVDVIFTWDAIDKASDGNLSMGLSV